MGPLVKTVPSSWGHGMDMDMQKMSSPSKGAGCEFAGKAELIYTEGCGFDGNDTSKIQ